MNNHGDANETELGKLLPTPSELSRIAATLARGRQASPEDSAAQAMKIWKACTAAIAEEQEEQKRKAHEANPSVRERKLLRGPLKVGNHFMPRVDPKLVPDGSGRMKLETFESIAIGLDTAKDRRKWLQSFLAAFRQQHAKRLESEDFATLSMERFPQISQLLENWKKEGVPEAIGWLEAFRRWRLTMEKAGRVRQTGPYDLEDCSKKGFDAETALNQPKSAKKATRTASSSSEKSRSGSGKAR